MNIQAPRGTYDILPEVIAQWYGLEEALRKIVGKYGYQEIRTPIIEHTELFERGVGEATDIVSKEMYSFNKEERSLTLRPEGTASCVRALLEHGLYTSALPVKWFYMGPMFRYDKPQAGRYRQFHQFGVEAFGSHRPELDAEVITLMIDIIQSLGIPAYELHLNSLGCPVCRETYRQVLLDYFQPWANSLCADCKLRLKKNPLRLLDCKEEDCRNLAKRAPIMRDYLCTECVEHYTTVKATLMENGISFLQDDSLVRGLDYYTNTAFEVHLPGVGAQSAIGGGGRYNGLVAACGGPENLPGIGFALGLERLLAAAKMTLETVQLDTFVVTTSATYTTQAVKLTRLLRLNGFSADLDYMNRSLKAQMKYANKQKAKLVLILGDEEIERGVVSIKHMDDGAQEIITMAELVSRLTSILKKQGAL